MSEPHAGRVQIIKTGISTLVARYSPRVNSWWRARSMHLRIAATLAVGWTLACALIPVFVGNEVGVPRTSCGPAVANLFGTGLSEYGPVLSGVCQDHALDRVVVYLAFMVPLAAYFALHGFRSRMIAGDATQGPFNAPRWPDALTYASFLFIWVIVPLAVFFIAKDRILRRNAARALEIQLLLPALAVWLIAATQLFSDFAPASMFWLLGGTAALVAVTATVGSIVCAVFALTNPEYLERWHPVLNRRGKPQTAAETATVISS